MATRNESKSMATLTLDDLVERYGELWHIWRTPNGGVWLARRHDLDVVREAKRKRVEKLDLTVIRDTAEDLAEAIEEQDSILEVHGL